MGWCSATEIMDTALEAAQEAVRAALAETGSPKTPTVETVQAVDDALRPFVAKLAAKLRDDDWDCIEESQYFERFAQEMLGDDDEQYEQRLLEDLENAAEVGDHEWIKRVTAKLDAHKKKMESKA